MEAKALRVAEMWCSFQQVRPAGSLAPYAADAERIFPRIGRTCNSMILEQLIGGKFACEIGCEPAYGWTRPKFVGAFVAHQRK